jgi:hypothetical protein
MPLIGNNPVIQMSWTLPAGMSPGYMNISLLFNYNGHFDSISPTSTAQVGSVITGTYNFSGANAAAILASAGTATYFQIGVLYNSSNDSLNPFYIDNIVLMTAPVPEPSTWALASVGLLALGLGLRRRLKIVA